MPVVSAEDAERFVNSLPAKEAVESLTVPELRVVAGFNGVPDCRNFLKGELVSLVWQQLGLDQEEEVEDSMFGVSTRLPEGQAGTPGESVAQVGAEGDVELRKLQLQLSLEEARSRSLVQQVRLAELQGGRSGGSNVSVHFDLGRAVKLVPVFNEAHLDDFFSSFERLATRLAWPKDQLTLILQQNLRGKALKAYMALSEQDAADYSKVKKQVLQAYSLVPEAYRQEFRRMRKLPEGSHLDLARRKREALVRWLRAKEVSTFEELVELILVEEFNQVVSREVATFLLEKECDRVEEAASLADKFVLSRPPPSRQGVGSSGQVPPPSGRGTGYSSCQRPAQRREEHRPGPPGRPTYKCGFCGRLGHTEAFCWKRLKPGRLDVGGMRPAAAAGRVPGRDQRPVGLISSLQEPQESSPPSATVVRDTKEAEGPEEGYRAFISQGVVKTAGKEQPVTILRDTGALQTLIRAGITEGEVTNEFLVLSSIWGCNSAPLIKIDLVSDCFVGEAKVAVLPELPTRGVDVILGNDLAGDRLGCKPLSPILQAKPTTSPDLKQLEEELPQVFPFCAVTRAMAKRGVDVIDKSAQSPDINNENSALPNDSGLTQLFAEPCSVSADGPLPAGAVTGGREALIQAQKEDQTLTTLWDQAEAESQDTGPTTTYFLRDGLLFRRWLPPRHPQEDADWAAVDQLVLPVAYRRPIVEIAHDGRFGGHLGVRKTLSKVLRSFFWPGVRTQISDFCRACRVCQKAGKPNQKIKPVHLVKVPHMAEPFAAIQIDVVGPLYRTRRGNEYIVTLIDSATRFVHAEAVRSITAPTVVRILKAFFANFGYPYRVQTDGASYFTGKVFRDFARTAGMQHSVSSPYHPESQGALERSHQTMKSILRKFSLEFNTNWDEELPHLLFVMRDMPSQSTGFSPYELVFAHDTRGPLHLVKQRLLGSQPKDFSLLDWVGELRNKLVRCWELASQHLEESQTHNKKWYDKGARHREYAPGDLVLLLLPLHGNPLQAKFQGPYKVLKRVSQTNYIVATPDRRRPQRLCHANMLKGFVQSPADDPCTVPVCLTGPDNQVVETEDALGVDEDWPASAESVGAWRDNKSARVCLSEGLAHLSGDQNLALRAVVERHPQLFRDTPGLTKVVTHDIEVVNDAAPIKLAPYRVHPSKVKLVREEIESMLQMGLIREGMSEWCAPVVLVPKSDGSTRLCIDYRRVNAVTKKDSFPLPRIDECIESIGRANFITKLDLLKGFWQIGLSERAQEICCFSTLGQTYLPSVLPFGLCNSPPTFMRLMSSVLAGIPNVVCYIDDIVCYTETWESHLKVLESVFVALESAGLVVNLSKCSFAQAQVQYLGHMVGLGSLSPPLAKVSAIMEMEVPHTKRQVRRFLGAVGYYRRYVKNFADLSVPLTELLKKGQTFKWTDQCEESFRSLQRVLCSSPVLTSPNFERGFKLACDASNVAVGAVLLQENDSGIDHPVAYFSKKLSPAQKNYATVEKELLSIILALQHFNFYLLPSEPVTVFTDHRPLSYLSSFRLKNQRLTRWSLYLQNFNLKVVHVKGVDNVIADALSRPAEV